MRLSVTTAATSSRLVWGVLTMFVMGLANMIWPTYGQEFLQTMASVYPGYKATANFGQVIVGSLYGVVDAAIIGAVFAWLHNLVLSRGEQA